MAFKHGAMVLAPAFGELVPDAAAGLMTQALSQGVAHEADLQAVKLNIFVARKDRMRKTKGREDTGAAPRRQAYPFVWRSPLLAGASQKKRAGCLEMLAPFWGLLRCAGPKSCHHMELDTVIFTDPGFEL